MRTGRGRRTPRASSCASGCSFRCGEELQPACRAPGLGCVVSYEDVVARLRALGATSYGSSVLGEALLAASLGPADAPAVLVIGGLHAMEHVGTLAALALAERVAAGEASPGWRSRRLVIAPLANPDGWRAVER